MNTDQTMDLIDEALATVQADQDQVPTMDRFGLDLEAVDQLVRQAILLTITNTGSPSASMRGLFLVGVQVGMNLSDPATQTAAEAATDPDEPAPVLTDEIAAAINWAKAVAKAATDAAKAEGQEDMRVIWVELNEAHEALEASGLSSNPGNVAVLNALKDIAFGHRYGA